ncbi:putative tRNA adenosine deaminase-associated protein [Asanoa ferruginea]|uniref:Putative tRNA adenosine deaminase-associated protein n=1 Tax=Asanoa ferruginea TaxID=53367 RepID=A0A3D9ZKS2_9ACTN|nr:tRNA adenosine deaminase-associated protein [Asanoa ferruginea]REF96523.1 putative tRNA adenosine deaminase-associated protein [Asanoa ferruginea]
MSYFAGAALRGSAGWTAAEVSLHGVVDVEEVADRLRDADLDADISLLFIESDDTYLVVMRLDEGEDLRIFGSDSAFADESRLGAILVGDIKVPAIEIDEVVERSADADPDKPAADPDADPVGDADLLADLGVSARRLLELCGHEGLLPADVTAEICQTIGCGDEVEELREA